MHEFNSDKRELAFEICTKYIKRGLNLNDRAAITAIGYAIQELSDEELNKTLEGDFVKRELAIATIIMDYIASKWEEKDNELYVDFVEIKDFYHSNISFYASKINMRLVKNAWFECMSTMGANVQEEKSRIDVNLNSKIKPIYITIIVSTLLVISLGGIISTINGPNLREQELDNISLSIAHEELS